MIDIYPPTEAELRGIQQREQAFYWSRCADALLRKHGVVACGLRHIDVAPDGLPVVLRGVRPSWPVADRPAAFEGPLAAETLAALGLEAEAVEVESCEWLDQDRRYLAELFYSTFSVRPIPSKRGEAVEPYPYLDPDPYWNNRSLRLQLLKPSEGWTPVAYARLAGRDSPEPIAVSDGRRLVIGAPVFDAIGFRHALPALDAGFYANIRNTNPAALEQWLVDRICELAERAGVPAPRTPIWPDGHRGALTIRHDYDRPVPAAKLAEMLAFYRAHDIKATWFLLVNKMPVAEQVEAMLADGHEIALHAEAPHFDDFRTEVEAFKAATGLLPAGYTCHGGIGSRGQLGLAQYQWSETLGLVYGEMIGRARSLPHPVHRPACGIPETGRLIVQNSHFSFDISTKPEAHQLELLSKLLPPAIASGDHVVIMNHPDIHWPELRTLLTRLDIDGIWRCTMAEVAEWANASKFGFKDYSSAVAARAAAARPPAAQRPPAGSGEAALPARARTEPASPPPAAALQVNSLPAAVPEMAAVFEGLGRQIRQWFAEHGRSASPASVLGTVRMNTADVPARVERLLEPIRQTLEAKPDFAALDVGCGYGGMPIYLASRYPDARITAIDTSERFFAVGRACAAELGLSNLEFRVEDLLGLSEAERYDVVVLSNVLNYLTSGRDLERGCANVMRALKPGGWAIVHTPHAWSYREPFTKLPLLHLLPPGLRGRVSGRLGKRASFADVRLPSYLELRRAFAGLGGTVERRHPAALQALVGVTHLSLWVRKGAPGAKPSANAACEPPARAGRPATHRIA